MFQNPKMKHQRENTRNKDKQKPIPQARNPLDDFNSTSTKSFSFHSNYLPSSSSSSSSSSNSSSKLLFSKNPKSLPKCTTNTTSILKETRGLTNVGSRKTPSILKNGAFPKPKMNQPCLRSGQNGENPISKNAQRSNFLTDLVFRSEKSKLENAQRSNCFADIDSGCEKPKSTNVQRLDFSTELASKCEKPKLENDQNFVFSADLASGGEKSELQLRCAKPKEVLGDSFNVKERDNDLIVNAENVTPINKSYGGSSLNSAYVEDSNGNSSSNSKVKTPPIKASVSPEIQFGASALLVSEATPNVCYGTGHVLSGVSDRRKCRSRGILTVGGFVDFTLGSGNVENVSCDYSCDGQVNEKVEELGALIPLPAEASVKWLLSPCDENSGSLEGRLSSKLMNLGDGEGSSPSMCIGSDSDLVWDSSERLDRILDMTNDSGKTCMVSPRRLSEFEGFRGSCSEKINGDFWSRMVEQDKNEVQRNIVEENSPLSIGSLSSGNVIQTPSSGYTSGKSSWLETIEHSTGTFKPEPDTEAHIFGGEKSILDPFQFTDLSSSSCAVDLHPLRKNFDNHVSSVSISSLDTMSQSHMRISWRDTLASYSSHIDELDCCRCLSDEDIGVDELQKLGNYCSSRRENGKSSGCTCKSPECIGQESAWRKKENIFPFKPKSCAESISTDGGGLAASEDFD